MVYKELANMCIGLVIVILCLKPLDAGAQSKIIEGEPCTDDPNWYPAEDKHAFLYCHAMAKVFTKQKCSVSFNGKQKVFDPVAQQCVFSVTSDGPSSADSNHSESLNLSPIDGRCVTNEQCSASSTGAECHGGRCACPNGTVPVNTTHGVVCSGAAMTCMQPVLSGNGPLNLTRYSYNSITDECEEFQFYGGTMVNSNVFHTVSQCENYCRTGCLRGDPEIRNGQTVPCASDDQCSISSQCYKRDNLELGLCCPSTESICSPFGGIFSNGHEVFSEPPYKEYDTGEDSDRASAIFYPAVRYYYSANEKKCKTFLYRGVGGNYNNFLSLEHCQNFCAAAACSLGGRPALDSKTKRWLHCRVDDQCPANFMCQNGTCCTGNRTRKASSAALLDYVDQACPEGTRAVLRDAGGVAFCDYENPCPQDAFCRISAASSRGEGICCAKRAVEHRPRMCQGNGSVPQRNIVRHPVECNLAQEEPCTPPHTCAYESINATSGYCCLMPLEAIVCPSGMEKIMNRAALGHRQCSPLHLSSCPEGGSCVFNEIYGIYYCCTAPDERNACPEGRTPYIDQASNSPLNCTSICPEGYECLDSPDSSSNLCCSEHPLARQCLVGKALTNQNGVPYSCSPSSPCAPGYYCVSMTDGSICCPRGDHLCSLTADVGSSCIAGLETVSYYFDATQRSCKTFLYRGCGGNDNRFSDIDQCKAMCYLSSICQHGQPFIADTTAPPQNRSDTTTACSEYGGCPYGFSCTATADNRSYCCPSADAVCQQAKSSGIPCDDIVRDMAENQRVWYFDFQLKKCQPMSYFGCAGNDNRFLILEACEQFCQPIVCPFGGRPLTDDQGEVQQCWKKEDCSGGYDCVASPGMAVQGGSSVCCPRHDTICLSAIDEGEPCGSAQHRYGYNRTSGRCESFQYLGCKANDNNFRRIDECANVCSAITTHLKRMSDVCGEETQVRQKRINRCKNSNDCPSLHRCAFGNQKEELGYCCPFPMSQCLTARTWRTQEKAPADECSFNNKDDCPANYSCQLTEDGYKRCCLAPDMSRVCPPHTIRGDIGRSQPVRCDHSDAQCPVGYACLHNRDFEQFFCCLDSDHKPRSISVASDNDVVACPNQTVPYIDPHLRTLRVCNPYLRFSCPADHECVYNGRLAQYQCCPIAGQGASGDWAHRVTCPHGQSPYFHTDDRPMVCEPNAKDCPSQSTCQYSPLYWQFICCVNSSSMNDHGPLEVTGGVKGGADNRDLTRRGRRKGLPSELHQDTSGPMPGDNQ